MYYDNCFFLRPYFQLSVMTMISDHDFPSLHLRAPKDPSPYNEPSQLNVISN